MLVSMLLLRLAQVRLLFLFVFKTPLDFFFTFIMYTLFIVIQLTFFLQFVIERDCDTRDVSDEQWRHRERRSQWRCE